MGADLILYIVVGDKEYDFEVIKDKAEEAFLKRREQVDRIRQVWEQGLDLNAELAGIAYELFFDNEDDVTEWLETNNLEHALHVVESFCNDYPNLGRDTNWRPLRDKLIVYCGGMSWGDSPDGDGYRMFRKLDELGLWEVFDFE